MIVSLATVTHIYVLFSSPVLFHLPHHHALPPRSSKCSQPTCCPCPPPWLGSSHPPPTWQSRQLSSKIPRQPHKRGIKTELCTQKRHQDRNETCKNCQTHKKRMGTKKSYLRKLFKYFIEGQRNVTSTYEDTVVHDIPRTFQ